MTRLTNLFRIADIPPIPRRSYSIELRHLCSWGVFSGLIEGSTASIVMSKTFGGNETLIALVWSAPVVANLLSVFWGALARGRRKLRLFSVIGAAAVVTVASIGITPSDPDWGAWLFAGQILLTRIFMTGLITIRSEIWKANYPLRLRGQLAGRLQMVRSILAIIVTALAAIAFQNNPLLYRLIYPAVSLAGIAGLILLQPMRVRGQERRLAEYRRFRAEHHGGRRHGVIHNMREAAGILVKDRRFAHYCAAQFCMGCANFMTEPILIIVVTKKLAMTYVFSSVLLDLVPMILTLASISVWARFFDRAGVLRYRVINSGSWLCTFTLAGIVILIVYLAPPSLHWLGIVVLCVARPMAGLCRGGGSIAWNLGHLHFAGKHNSELYMGVHATLTGIRGAIMPFVGVQLMRISEPLAVFVAVGLAATGHLMFRMLERREHERPKTSAEERKQAARTIEFARERVT
jgi:hypothetical protein